MRTVGVLGGFGPETTADFYVSLVRKNRELNRRAHPNLLIHNAPVPFKAERDVVKNARNLNNYLPLLINGIRTLQDKVDFIVIPCNTVHVFIEKLRRESKVPVISIIEETIKVVESRQIKKIGLLATSQTIKTRLFDGKLQKSGVELLKPDEPDQKRVSALIHVILKGCKTDKMKSEFSTIIKKLQADGAEAIILGCTDLQLLLEQKDFSIELIDTLDVLADATIERLWF
jgi:aspartate racemase